MWPHPELRKVPILHESVDIHGPCPVKSRSRCGCWQSEGSSRSKRTRISFRSQVILGLVNYSGRLIPDLATLLEPLRRLTKKDVEFQWGPEQAETFQKLKNKLARAEILGYYDKDAETRVITDASPVGLGAVFAQKQHGNSGSLCMPVEV